MFQSSRIHAHATPRRSQRRHLLVAALVLAVAIALTTLIGSPSATAASKKKRYVALTPFSANTMANIGARPTAIGAMAIGKKGMSPKLRRIKQLSLSHPNGPNMEQLAMLNPDVVFSSPTWRKGARTMRDLSIRVIDADPRTTGALPGKIRRIGKTVGRERAAKRYVRKVNREIRFATKGRKIKQRPRVLMVLGVGRTPYVFLPNSWGGDIVKRAGGRLLTSGLKNGSGFAKISDEFVIQQDPDVIISVPHGNSSDIPAIRDHLLNNPAWSTTDAVKNRRIYVAMDDALLQPNVDVGHTIKRVRTQFLKNW